MSQVTVISGVERRRMWSVEQKRALIAASLAPGVRVAEVARRADVRASQIYRWRHELGVPADPEQAFAPVVVSADHDRLVDTGPAVVIELRGVVVRIAGNASPALVTATLRALRR